MSSIESLVRVYSLGDVVDAIGTYEYAEGDENSQFASVDFHGHTIGSDPEYDELKEALSYHGLACYWDENGLVVHKGA